MSSQSPNPPRAPTPDILSKLISDEVPIYVTVFNQKFYVNNILSIPQVVQIYEPVTGLCTTNGWRKGPEEILENIMENKSKNPETKVEISMNLLNILEGTVIDPYERIDEESVKPIVIPPAILKEIIKYNSQYDKITGPVQKANSNIILTTDSRGDGRINGSLLSPELQKIHEHLCNAYNELESYYRYHDGFKIDVEFPEELSVLSSLQWYVGLGDYEETTSDYYPHLRIVSRF